MINLILVQNREEIKEELTEVSNDINIEEIEVNESRPGRENHDIMEGNEQTSRGNITEENKEMRELF